MSSGYVLRHKMFIGLMYLKMIAIVQVNILGQVRIQCKSPFNTPFIEINQIIEYIRFLRKLLIESQFSKYIDEEFLPGSQFKTDEQLKEYINKYVWKHHAWCTNKVENIMSRS
jgi:choline dehydrogenase